MGGIWAVVIGLVIAGFAGEFMVLATDPPGVIYPDRVAESGAARAKQAEAFGAACLSAALSSPGATGSITPAMPAGVNVPAGGICEAYAAGGGGRNVYAVVTLSPGMGSQFARDQSVWWSVGTGSTSTNLLTAQTQPPPTVASTGDAYEWVAVNP